MLTIQITFQDAAIITDPGMGFDQRRIALHQHRQAGFAGTLTLIDPDGDVVAVLGGES